MITNKIWVKGKVQGVFYRQSARKIALALGLKGTVKNLDNGHTVELFVTGKEEQLTAFIEWCKEGPPRAIVKSVEVFESTLLNFNGFSIL